MECRLPAIAYVRPEQATSSCKQARPIYLTRSRITFRLHRQCLHPHCALPHGTSVVFLTSSSSIQESNRAHTFANTHRRKCPRSPTRRRGADPENGRDRRNRLGRRGRRRAPRSDGSSLCPCRRCAQCGRRMPCADHRTGQSRPRPHPLTAPRPIRALTASAPRRPWRHDRGMHSLFFVRALARIPPAPPAR